MNIKRLFIISGSILLGLTFTLIWLLSGPPVLTRAANYTVCTAGPPTCDYSTIQAAVDASLSGDTIIVASGIYTENVSIIGTSLTIEGSGTVSTIVDGNASGSVFTINAGAAVTITDMTVTN
jgi:pectin methylesterase-like acyl-CoA thioesterase